MDGIALKIARIEYALSIYLASSQQDNEVLKDISTQMAATDSMIEFYGLPNELSERYNQVKLEFAKVFSDKRIYYSTNRGARIDNIINDVEHLAEMTQFISEQVENQNTFIELLEVDLEKSLAHLDGTIKEIEARRRKVSSKMRVWRIIFWVLMFFLAVFSIRLLMR